MALALFGLIGISACLRGIFAWRHSTPRYFPDEYIYAALGRAIAQGRLDIRGSSAHFPALLEPILAAPIWRGFGLEPAFHLVQVENAIAASLACIPVYSLSRHLGLSKRAGYATALYAVVIPALTYIPYILADPIAYTLALAAVAAAVRGLDDPSWRHQAWFVGFAAAASLSRVQYVALFVAYALAAAALDRRRAIPKHRLLGVVLVAGAAAALAVGPGRLLGYYSGVLSLHVGTHVVRWFLTTSYLLALDATVLIVPGALAGLLGTHGRRERAFALFTGALFFLLVAEAAVYSASGGISARFKERYVFVLLPLAAIAFAMYARRPEQRRRLVIGVAAVLVVAAARLPISEYTTSAYRTDSQFLFALGFVQDRIGAFGSSLLVSLVATAAAICAVAVSFKGRGMLALCAAAAVSLLLSVAATHVDLDETSALRQQLPQNLHWIDSAGAGRVTAIATPGSSPARLLNMLFWNTSVQREALLDNAVPTDAFGTPPLKITPRGALSNTGDAVLIDEWATIARFDNGAPIARIPGFSLWRTRGRPRLRLLVEGRYSDRFLEKLVRIRAWPRSASAGVRVDLALSLPRSWSLPAVSFTVGSLKSSVARGETIHLSCRARRGLDVTYSAGRGVFVPGPRLLTTRLDHVVARDIPLASAPSRTRCVVTG